VNRETRALLQELGQLARTQVEAGKATLQDVLSPHFSPTFDVI